jgi:hydrogenase maturation factor
MRVTSVDEAGGLATCAEADGSTSTVEVGLVGPVVAGDTLLVHAGTALVRLEAEALTG